MFGVICRCFFFLKKIIFLLENNEAVIPFQVLISHSRTH